MKITTIIVAAGTGSRMQADLPKQFARIGGRAMLMRTIDNFTHLDGQIIVVLNPDSIATWRQLCLSENFTTPHTIVHGGSERFFSVKNALSAVNDNTQIILVQDGVRPFTTPDLIKRVVAAALLHGAAVPVIPVVDSLRTLTQSVDRNSLFAVQTPQGFKATILKQAYQNQKSPQTDDATVVQAALGQAITLVDGDPNNIKITLPIDLKLAEILCSKS